MPDDTISDAEILYRSVPNKAEYWSESEQRLTSAVFSDSVGVSVDRDGSRSEDEIIASFDSRFPPDCGIVSIIAQQCREIGAFPVPKPTDDNPHHAYIQQSQDQVLLSKSTQRKLRRSCTIVRRPAIAQPKLDN